MHIKVSIITFLALFISCKSDSIKGINIGTTLFQNQTFQENKILKGHIIKTLECNEIEFQNLINFDCASGAGCYDLGFIIIQIEEQIGKKKFNKLLSSLNASNKNKLKGYISIGIEYGYENQKASKYEHFKKNYIELIE